MRGFDRPPGVTHSPLCYSLQALHGTPELSFRTVPKTNVWRPESSRRACSARTMQRGLSSSFSFFLLVCSLLFSSLLFSDVPLSCFAVNTRPPDGFVRGPKMIAENFSYLFVYVQLVQQANRFLVSVFVFHFLFHHAARQQKPFYTRIRSLCTACCTCGYTSSGSLGHYTKQPAAAASVRCKHQLSYSSRISIGVPRSRPSRMKN